MALYDKYGFGSNNSDITINISTLTANYQTIYYTCGDKKSINLQQTTHMTLPTDVKGKAAGSAYLTIEPGQTEVLIVGPAVTGYQYWRNEGGPVRQPDVFDEPLPDDCRMKDIKDKFGNIVGSEKEKQQFYWAMPVYNFKTNNFELAQFTQKGIREELLKLQNNPNWGDPTGKYTITIDKSGTGFQTKYSVMANPTNSPERKAELELIMAKYHASPIDVAGDLFGDAAVIEDQASDTPAITQAVREETGLTSGDGIAAAEADITTTQAA